MFSKKLALLLSMLAFAAAPIVAQDDSSDEEPQVSAVMTVTAEKREETITEVPISITAFSAESMEEKDINGVREAVRFVPNVFTSHFATKRTNSIYIRGIGSGQGDPAVSVYVDGVPMLSDSAANIDFLGVDRVEVLRGPQGTLYGRNTIGGLVQYITQQPSNDLSYTLKAEAGEYNHIRASANFSGALVEDKVYFVAGYSRDERDGYTDNLLLNTTQDDKESNFYRAGLVFTPSADWNIRLNIYNQEDRDGGFTLYDLASLRQQPYEIFHDFADQFTERDVFGTSINATYSAEKFDVTFIAAYTEMDSQEQTDLDFTPLDGLRRTTLDNEEQTYLELRLNSAEPIAVGDAWTMEWLVGVSATAFELTNDSTNELRPGFTQIPNFSLFTRNVTTRDEDGSGLFGQVSFTWDETVTLDFGLRFANDDRAGIANIADDLLQYYDLVNVDESYDEVLPRIGITTQMYENTSVYLTLARSYRPGGYNGNTAPGAPFLYDAEIGETLEVGMKRTFMDGRGYFAGALFFNEWEDRQLSIANTNIPIPGFFFLDNVTDSETSGGELELAVRINDTWTASGFFGGVESSFGSYTDLNGVAVKGNALPQTPDYTSGLSLNHNSIIGDSYNFTFNVDYLINGGYYFDAANTEGQGRFDLLNARIGVAFGGLRLELFGRNLADEEYFPVAIPGTLTPWVGSIGDPRSVGLSVSYRR